MNPAILDEVPRLYRKSYLLGSRRRRQRPSKSSQRTAESNHREHQQRRKQTHQHQHQHQHQKPCQHSAPNFHPDTVDTFCFRWPAQQCYVLARLLDDGVALCPIPSRRRAFLYFAHAPMPRHPPPALPRTRRPSKVQTMFQSWKHTLAVDDAATASRDNSDDADDVDDENSDGRIPRNSNDNDREVTLADVLEEASDLIKDGWIKTTQFNVKTYSGESTTILLQTSHSTFKLSARSVHEKRMFVNLVRMLQHPPSSTSTASSNHHPLASISVHSMIENWRQKCRSEWTSLADLQSSIHRSQSDISTWMRRMETLDDSFRTLRESLQEYLTVDQNSRKLLSHAEEQLGKSSQDHEFIKRRLQKLDTVLAADPDIVGTTRLKLMMDRQDVNNDRLWMYILVLTTILIFIIVFALHYILS